ncbi:MAG: sigma-70 family RNA polymerase sigma factor [Myxococcota bacterium]
MLALACYPGLADRGGPMQDEYELLQAWRAGDRRAGSRLIAARSREITWFFRNKVFDLDAVPDLVSQTFLRSVSARDRFAGETSFRRFIYAIAQNVLREYLRSVDKRAREELDFVEVCICDLRPRSMSSLQSEKVQVQALIEALREVPIGDQVVLELKYFEGMSAREVGDALGVPEGTVRGRLARGLVRLRERVQAQLSAGSARARDVSAEDIDAWAADLRRLRGLDP